MPLNVPTTHPIIPVMMYDPAMSPPLPHVHVPDVVQGIVPLVAVELINQLGLRSSSSPVRMACYNQSVMNNFMNQEFKELLELTCQYIVLKYKKGYIRSPQEGLEESVKEILSLWMSNMVMVHPELKAACSPQIVHAAYQNAPVFNNLKVEIQTMMNQQPMQQSPQGWGQPQQPQQPGWGGAYPQQGGTYPQQPPQGGNWGPHPNMMPQQMQQLPSGQWMTNQYGQQVFVPTQPMQMMQQPQQQGWGQPQPQPWGGGTGGFQYQRPVVGDPRMQGGYQQPNVVEASNIAKDVALQSRFMGQLNRNRAPGQELAAGPTPAPPPPTQYQQQVYQPVQQPEQPTTYQHVAQQAPMQTIVEMDMQPIQEAEPFKFKELKIKGGSEMDRANHAVAYFGEEVRDQTIQRRQEVFSKSAEELAKASASTLELPEGVEPEVNDSGVQVSNTVLYEIAEEPLALGSKMKYLRSRDGETPSPMFRIFGKVANPFVGRKSLKHLNHNLRSVNSLSKLAERMKIKMKEALTGKGGLRSPDDQDAIAYLNYLDTYFTKKVNNILNNNLKANLRITSFTTDVGGIGEFLREKRSQAIGYAWDECANGLFSRFISSQDESMDMVINENFEVPENLEMVVTPTTISYTFTELTLAELGFEFNDNPVGIPRDKAPALYKLAASLSKHKKELEIDTDIDYLVTSDGAKYIIYKNYAATGENFNIGEAS